VNNGFINCSTFTGSVAPKHNWLHGLAAGIAKLVSPKPLYAVHVGLGGLIPAGARLSSFTWALPIQVSKAGLAVNVLRSGKDAIAVAGKFNLATKGFAPEPTEAGFLPDRDAVTVGLGTNVYTIAKNTFKYSTLLKRWVYASKTSTGVTAMEISAVDGTFTVAATVPTEGALPTDRPFSLQLGNRVQGVRLLCNAQGVCAPEEH
jgi:hypothetical protein